ncbi:MAG: LytTR family transcriptional regulator [Alistipes sp.]|nr:LytTR family transcriptional regulator [Alistipes sp.]
MTFSFLFMAIYTPFSNTVWFDVSNRLDLGMTVAFYIVAVSIMLVSKMLMNAMQHRICFTYAKYIMWVVVEILAIALFYTHFTNVYVQPEDYDAANILVKALGCILMIVAIPYTILTLYAAYRDKTEELEILQYEMSLNEEPSVSYPSLVNLYDYNGTLKLTINSESLYYMESQDNYVKIYYENQGKLLSYMLRCRTKVIEENLADTSMVRCHRSYIVNVMKINHIKKGGKSRYIVLTNEQIKPIPVSKSYFKNIIEKIDAYNASVLKSGTFSAAMAEEGEAE